MPVLSPLAMRPTPVSRCDDARFLPFLPSSQGPTP